MRMICGGRNWHCVGVVCGTVSWLRISLVAIGRLGVALRGLSVAIHYGKMMFLERDIWV